MTRDVMKRVDSFGGPFGPKDLPDEHLTCSSHGCPAAGSVSGRAVHA